MILLFCTEDTCMLRCVQTGCVAERPKVMEQILRVFKNLVFFY